MGAADTETEVRPPKVERPLWRRLLKFVLVATLTLVVVLGLAIGFFHLPVGKDIIRGMIEDGVAQRFDGKVTLGAFDWAIFSDIQLSDLQIATPDGRPVVKVASVGITPDWGSLTGKPRLERIAVKGVTVDLEAFDDGTNTLTRMQREVPTQLVDASIDALTLEGLNVVIRAPADASLQLANGAGELSLDLGLLETGSLTMVLKSFTADVTTIAPRTTSALRAEAELGETAPWKGGTRARFPLSVQGRVDVGWGAPFTVGEAGPKPPAAAPTRLDAVFTPTGGELVVESPDVRLARAVMKLPLELPRISARLDAGKLVVEVGSYRLGPMSTAGIVAETRLLEALAAGGAAAVAAAPIEVSVRGFHMDAEGLNALTAPPSQAEAGTPAPPPLLADIDADLGGKGTLGDLRLSGEARWGAARLGLDGQLDLRNALLPVWEFTFKGRDIAPKALLALPQAPEIAARFELWLKGRGLFPPDADLETRLDLSGLEVAGEEVDTLTLAAGVAGEKITVSQFEVKVFGQRLLVTGEADRVTRSFRAVATSRLDLARAFEETAIAELLPSPLPRGSGTLALDLAVSGRLTTEAMAALEEGVRAQRPPDLPGLPFEALDVDGKVAIDALKFNDFELGSLAFDLDLKGDGGPPAGPLTLLVKDVVLAPPGGRTMRIDKLALDVALAGPESRFRVEVESASEALAFVAAGRLGVDVDAMTGRLTLETLDATRGAFKARLDAPTTLDLARDGARLAPLRLAVGGGVVALDADVRVDPPADGAPATIRSFRVDGSAEGLDTARLAAALGPAGRGLRNVPARIDGFFRASGTPAAPSADFRLTARTRARTGVPALIAEIDGDVATPGAKGRLSVRPAKAAGRRAWFEASWTLPVLWPETPGGMARLAGSRPMALKAELLERSLARWGEALGLEGLAGEASLEADIGGTPARPKGAWSFLLELPRVPNPRGGAALPALRVAAGGNVTPGDGRGVAHVGKADIMSDNVSLAHSDWRGTLAVSPLLLPLGAPLPAWTLEGSFHQDLGAALAWARLLLPPAARTTRLTAAQRGTFKAHGRGADVAADLDATLSVDAADGPEAIRPFVAALPLSSSTRLTVSDDALRLVQTTTVDPARGGETLSSAELEVGLGGRGLLRTLPRLMRQRAAADFPISGRFSAPRRAIDALARLFRLPPDLVADLAAMGGTVGADVRVGGRLGDPTLDGGGGWIGFRTTGGGTANAEFRLATGDDLGLELLHGPPGRAFRIGVEAPRLPAILKAFQNGQAARVRVTAGHTGGDAVSLGNLTPAHPLLAKLPPVEGALRGDIAAVLDVFSDGANLDALGGGLQVDGLALPIPESSRRFRDGRVVVSMSRDAVTLDTFELHESDDHREDRWLKLTGRVDLASLAAELRVTSLDFLIGGLGPDAPDGELDLDLAIGVVPGSPLGVTLRFDHLDLDAPDRFVRAHYAQILSHGDVFDPARLGDAMPAPGVLPVPKGLVPPIPESLALNVAIIFPKPGRLGFFPLDIDLVGRLDATIADRSVDLRGRLDVPRGTLGAMGWDLDLHEGAITADGPLDTAKMELTFGIEPVAIAQRDTTITGWHGGKAFITARATVNKGLETIFSGVGGPNVLDMATFLNTGRARLFAAPDLPPSATVRFGNLDQGLVNTFIATNLRNFIFMDRTLGWSDSLVDHAAYGRVERFDMQRFVDDTGLRVAMKGRPPAMGVNRLELGLDWLLLNRNRAVMGVGPRLGLDARLGLGVFWEWSSAD